MGSFYQSCFDADKDQNTAQYGEITVGVKTGDVYAGRVMSKFFAEAVLMVQVAGARLIGLPDSGKDNRVVVKWVTHPASMDEMTGVLDCQTGRFWTDAKENYARQTLGLLGFALAIRSHVPKLRDAWVRFSADLGPKGVQAVFDTEILQDIMTAINMALESADPTGRAGAGWQDPEPLDDLELPVVTDVRDYLLSVEDFERMMQEMEAASAFDTSVAGATVFKGPQFAQLSHLVQRHKHTILLGPPGTGKSLCAFEVLKSLGFKTAGVDFQVFTGHDEVKSADLYGGYQPTGTPGQFIWTSGVLVRAMTANGGRGQPLLIEELTRMPRRAQNALLTALSDGYVVLNERPTETGEGEIIRAGPDFVLIADMNVDPTVDDVELFGGAFASRVRKIWYEYPSTTAVQAIVRAQVPDAPDTVRAAVGAAYDQFMKKWQAGEVAQPISPRDCVYWAEEIMASPLMSTELMPDSSEYTQAAVEAARVTWLRDVAGYENTKVRALESEIEAVCRKVRPARKGKAA